MGFNSAFKGLIYCMSVDEVCVGAVGGGTVLQTGRSRVRFTGIFIDMILPAALWPWG